MEEKLFTSELNVSELDTENILRPKNLSGFIGQERVKDSLSVYTRAAKSRGETLDHVLLYGSAGLGKTTLAHLIAAEMGSRITVTSGPAIERAADLAAILTNLGENDAIFIDEIHRMNSSVAEILYPAMEDFALDFIVGKGPGARSVRLPLPHFTLIGATTKVGMLTQPFRDRFGVRFKLEMYTPEQLQIIIENSARLLNAKIDPAAARTISCRSRGTPRIANRLLKRVRDYAEVKNAGHITTEVTVFALSAMEIDELGLDGVDKSILSALIDKFNGGPAGIEAIASVTGEDAATIEDVYEPYLMQLGFIMRTPRGRICLPPAYRHLGRKVPAHVAQNTAQMNIFEEPAPVPKTTK